MSDVPTIPFDEYTRPFRDRVDSGTHRSFSQAGLASVLPYPTDEVTNSLVELDLAEGETEHLTALARTADRLAAAYAASVLIVAKRIPLASWQTRATEAQAELAEAWAEYREVRGL